MGSETQPQEPRSAGVYVHFPWCLAKCPYCDFVSYASSPESLEHDAYANAVVTEIEARAALMGDITVRSVFFGGGTPSLWDARALGRVLATIQRAWPTASELEITVECNPTSLDADRASRLRDAGVNRVSIGVQSLRDPELKFLGRLHDASLARRSILGALASGMPRVSADLIFGLPGQDPRDAVAQACELQDMGLSHLSCYQLTIEPGTQFGELARRGRLPLADDGRTAEAFLAIDEALATRGLDHYEISNYAARGHRAEHNLGYWRGEPYVGLGAAAFGFYRTHPGGMRYRNRLLPAQYMHEPAAFESREPLDAEALLRERIMLGLRVVEGFDIDRAARDLGIHVLTAERQRAIDALCNRGRLEQDGSRLRIPKAAWLFTDDTAARLF